ncbi:MAG TPA: site-2 protease family protein [Candidatus Competibacteraceae bacterium]|nr:site-2 protease family protein [Candidatus Competibacteraceae bacterium]
MQELTLIQKLIVWIPPVLLAITLHEVAHGWVALQFGDPTAKTLGRLSLNPLRHVDPIGTVLLPLVLFFLGGFIFGWAKPVPVDLSRVPRPRHAMVWVALAGPAANVAMALVWALLLKLGLTLAPVLGWAGLPLYYMGVAGISINVVLAALNLLPIPPLDGSKVLMGILPPRLAWRMARLEPYGMLIVLLLLALGWLPLLLGPIIHFLHLILSLLLGNA